MPTFVGTSGWQYRHWKGRYYASDLAQDRWLERYAADFATVELNSSFYNLPRRATFEAWAARTPPDFAFAVKASRYLTHVRRLRDPREPVERLVDAARGLGPRLGPILLQLPPSLERDEAALDETLDAFPRDVRVAVEPRHASWFDGRGPGPVAAPLGGALLGRPARARHTGVAYDGLGDLRLHEGAARPRPCYAEAAIGTWVERLARAWPASADRFVDFNNDPGGCAVRDAAIAARLFEGAELEPTRTPRAADIRVG